ncbi:MAG TPA: choice-of-anchor J domain-containing protein [Phycisphaerales bacterium]|nr:choice-of-anchor J domain-containing protein [Phycisphaerales bacterium]
MTRRDDRRARRMCAAVGVCALLACAGQSLGQADFYEGFDDNGSTNSGQDGPSNLIARGWIFRNQSQPEGAHSWFDGYTSDQWPRPQAGEGYLAVDSLSTDYFGGKVSNWAILPAVPGQIAGDVLTFYALDLGGNNVNRLQVRYSPSGGTGTGSGAEGVGDFTTVLLDLNPIPADGWNKYTVTLPGTGRVALRYYIGSACNWGCFSSYTGLDSLSVGDEPPPACNMPPVPAAGETVVWTAADSPYEICENISIPPNSKIIVESGVEAHFDQGTQLVVGGTLEVQGAPGDLARFTYPSVFPPMIEVTGGAVDASFAEFDGQFRAKTGEITLTGCEFRGNGVLIGDELQESAAHIVLEGCLFDGVSATISDGLVEMRANTFLNANCWLLRGYSIVEDGNTFDGGRLTITREDTTQPFYVDGVHASGYFEAAPLQLEGGNFLIGQDIDLENNLYPMLVRGGLAPGSNVPTSGNSINVIDVGSGGFAGVGRWPDFGVPYRITEPGPGEGGSIFIDPGVVVESVDGGGLALVSGRRLVADGTPEEPITFRAVSNQWQGLIYHVNSTAGPRLEYCTIEDARFGVISTDNHLYVDNCTFLGNSVGANCNTYGSIFFRKSLFTANQAGVAMTDLGTPLLLSFTNPNAFEGNSAAIDAFEFGSAADANLVWWGHPTGPQHPQNPDGQGDPIIGDGAAGVSIFPFLTERPDFANTPPVVRMTEPGLTWRGSTSTDHLLEAGDKYILRWDADDDGSITSQRIEFSPDGHYDSRFDVLVDNIPGDARTWEITVPEPGFAVTNQPQFIRIVAVDDAGQEAWDQVRLTVPSGRLSGNIEITTDLSGQTFYAGQPFPTVDWTGSVNDFPTVEPYIILESDGSAIAGLNIGGDGQFFGDIPNISTDTARLAVRASNNSNDVVWFFADGYFSIRHDPRLGLVPPTVVMSSPTHGASFTGGGVVPIRWTASDDEALYGFDVQASYDGGRTFHTVVMDLPASARSYDWRLPASDGIDDVRVRVIARDIRFQNSSDGAESSFAILPGDGCAADFNGDGAVDTRDVIAFLNAWTAGDDRADVNGDGTIDTRDVLGFLNLWNLGC